MSGFNGPTVIEAVEVALKFVPVLALMSEGQDTVKKTKGSSQFAIHNPAYRQ